MSITDRHVHVEAEAEADLKGMRQEFPVNAQITSRPTEQVDDESTQFGDDTCAQVRQKSDERCGGKQYRDDYAHLANEVCLLLELLQGSAVHEERQNGHFALQQDCC